MKATKTNTPKSLKEIASEKAKGLRCNCDLDNWQPDIRTGHSFVCRIHKAAVDEFYRKSNTNPALLY